MRFLINFLIAVMLVGLLGGVMLYHNAAQLEREQLEAVREEVRRFDRQIMLQATLRQVDLTERGYPLTVEAEWFEGEVPQNTLLPGSLPWVEVAHEDDRELDHPPVKIAHSGQARFWYNPYNGHVRARVPASTSDAAALRIYNFINSSNLPSLFTDDPVHRATRRR